jgi:hypothetical protein
VFIGCKNTPKKANEKTNDELFKENTHHLEKPLIVVRTLFTRLVFIVFTQTKQTRHIAASHRNL